MKLVVRKHVRLLIVAILTLSFDSVAQSDRSVNTHSAAPGIPSCDKVTAQKLDLVRRGRTSFSRLYGPIDQKLLSPALRDLIKASNVREIVTSSVKGPKQKVILMVGHPRSEEGVQDWFIQFGKNAVTFKSIATNSNLIFWDEKGELNYFAILYSGQQTEKDPRNVVSLDFRRFRLGQDGAPALIEKEENVRCMLKLLKPM
jgi:hypothetical protein